MKRIIISAAAFLLMVGGGIVTTASAQTYVRGYYKSNGTYVAPHYRSSANSTVRDNYTYKGNTNPYTGKTGTNRYTHSPSSQYYQPSYRYSPPKARKFNAPTYSSGSSYAPAPKKVCTYGSYGC